MGMEARITSTARKHKLSSGRIREALSSAAFVRMDGDMAMYVGTDARGLVIELGVVKDDRGAGFAVVHAMPREWRMK
jgi:hypothetical protein